MLARKIIAETVAKMTGIPLTRIDSGEAESPSPHGGRTSSIRDFAAFGDPAHLVVRCSRSRSGLKDPREDRSVHSFFWAPRELVKHYSPRPWPKFLFGEEDALIQVDMSEFMEKHNISRLVGAPPGYVGYEEGGQLTEKIRRRPYSVVLLDEVEKAHIQMCSTCFLQVMEEGHM